MQTRPTGVDVREAVPAASVRDVRSPVLPRPVASLLVENDRAICAAEVWIGAQTIRDIRLGGRAASLEAAERLTRQLEPLLWQAATGRLPRAQDTPARAKPRRTRAEVLAGVRQASEMAQAAKLRRMQGELRAIQAEPQPGAGGGTERTSDDRTL
jgi:hypothetical protein